MTRSHCRDGKICLRTHDAGCQPPVSVGAKTTATAHDRVMSRQCAHYRLHTRIRVTPTCWIWTGARSTDKTGMTYGQFMLDGKRMGAHRASYLIHVGPVDDGLDVMHSCDVKPCVRPSHLSPGTRSQNLLDGFAAHPGVCAGENNGRARLTWDQVHAIRAERKAGASQTELSRKYGVHQVQISHIVRGTRWPESKCPVHGSVEVAA